VAVASGRVLLGRAAFELVAANAIKKGDVLTVAQASVFTSIYHKFEASSRRVRGQHPPMKH